MVGRFFEHFLVFFGKMDLVDDFVMIVRILGFSDLSFGDDKKRFFQGISDNLVFDILQTMTNRNPLKKFFKKLVISTLADRRVIRVEFGVSP